MTRALTSFEVPLDPVLLPDGPGAYVLELHPEAPLSLTVGRLGVVEIPAGRARYYGSARGPGGLRARVARHLRPPGERRVHWHVDHLTARLAVQRVLIAEGGRECELVQRDLAAGWRVVAAGFGATDCRRACPAHLLAQPCQRRPGYWFGRQSDDQR
jgi:histidyl-tRNA synthetase